MPARLNSIIGDNNEKWNRCISELAFIATTNPSPSGIHVNDPRVTGYKKDYMSFEAPLVDILTTDSAQKVVGKDVVLIENKQSDNNALLLQDVNLVLRNDNPIKIKFERQIDCVDGLTSHYDISLPGESQRLTAELVNEQFVEKDLEGKTKEVFLSIFPFRFNTYKNIDQLNDDLARDFPEVEHGGEKRKVVFGEYFTASSMPEENTSMLIGKIKSYRRVKVPIDKEMLDFYIVQLETGFGLLPMAVGLHSFGPKNIEEGDVIFAAADVKLDFFSCPDRINNDSKKAPKTSRQSPAKQRRKSIFGKIFK